MPSLDERKRTLRAEARRRRAEAAAASVPDGPAEAVCARVLAAVAVPAGCAVSAYWPMRSELDPRPLMHRLHERGHAIGLPVIVGKGRPLAFREWRPGVPLEPGGFGTLVPPAGQRELRPQALFVPLLAFDRVGYRLGYGGGFYDRTLAELRAAGRALAVGLAYAAQEVPAVPHDVTDQRLDWIVTEAEAIETKA
ncbi:MAG: 5-formyltetrahydrofolate cyclo-ligase [Kiloniellaceae bacterium]